MSDLTQAQRRKRAARAVRNFNRMIPGLRTYARKASGNPRLELKAGKNSQTDGKTITIAPPVALGDSQKHNGLCNVRENGMSVCGACAAREELTEILHHEIGHILYGSFGKWDAAIIYSALAVAERGHFSAIHASRIRSSIGSFGAEDSPLIKHTNAARHPWLSLVMLVMEDARCDEARMRYNPLEQEVFDATNEDLLINGCQYQDGTIKHYYEMDRDTQACLGFLYTTRMDRHDLVGYFDDEIVELLDDDKIVDISEKCIESADTTQSFCFALQLFNLFNERGFCEVNDKSEDEIEEIIKMLAELLVIIVGHDQSIDGSPVPGVLEEAGAGGSANNSDEESKSGLRPEDIEMALESLKNLDVVPINVGAPIIYEPGQGTGSGYSGDLSKQKFRSDERNLTPALTAARLAFGVNARVQHHRNQRSGKVSGKTIAKRVPFGDDRIFAKKVQPDKRDYAVVIGMDISGSTSGLTLEEEKFAVLAMADVLHRLGIKFEVWAHSTGYDQKTYEDRPDLYKIKDSSTPWTDETRNTLRKLRSCGANLDGHTLQFYRKRLEAMRATDKILMYYTDGAMPATNYAEELEVLKSEIKHCHKTGITLMAVGMGVDSPKEHGFDTCRVDSPKDYRKVVEHLGKRLQ